MWISEWRFAASLACHKENIFFYINSWMVHVKWWIKWKFNIEVEKFIPNIVPPKQIFYMNLKYHMEFIAYIIYTRILWHSFFLISYDFNKGPRGNEESSFLRDDLIFFWACWFYYFQILKGEISPCSGSRPDCRWTFPAVPLSVSQEKTKKKWPAVQAIKSVAADEIEYHDYTFFLMIYI